MVNKEYYLSSMFYFCVVIQKCCIYGTIIFGNCDVTQDACHCLIKNVRPRKYRYDTEITVFTRCVPTQSFVFPLQRTTFRDCWRRKTKIAERAQCYTAKSIREIFWRLKIPFCVIPKWDYFKVVIRYVYMNQGIIFQINKNCTNFLIKPSIGFVDFVSLNRSLSKIFM